MATKTNKTPLTVKAYQGDNKTLLAFNFKNAESAAKLAGFTIACQPPGQPSYFLFNELQFETPGKHAQVASEPPNSSVNAPIHKFRWVHFPGSMHQGLQPATGSYTYTVTPRYFDDRQSMLPMDPSLNSSETIHVGPFEKKGLSLGFTRGYMQSEAFTHHFGRDALIKPKDNPLLFDTSQVAGKDAKGKTHTFAEEYEWMGSTARKKVFALLNEVLKDSTLRLDMFAYDLNEPDLMQILLALAKKGRIRIILDNAALHAAKDGSKPEDQFTTLFSSQAGAERIKRGKERVNIAKLKPADNLEPAVTGGYIFKKDHEKGPGGFWTSQGIHFYYVDPKEANLTPQQKTWLTGYVNRFEKALSGDGFKDPARGYAAFIHPDSFIDLHWIVELSKNIDGYRLSNYLHKDREGKLKMEPIWD